MDVKTNPDFTSNFLVLKFFYRKQKQIKLNVKEK